MGASPPPHHIISPLKPPLSTPAPLQMDTPRKPRKQNTTPTTSNAVIASNTSQKRASSYTKISASEITFSAHTAAGKSSKSARPPGKTTGTVPTTPPTVIRHSPSPSTIISSTHHRHVVHVISPSHPWLCWRIIAQLFAQGNYISASSATSRYRRRVIPRHLTQKPSSPISHRMNSLMEVAQRSAISATKLCD